MYLKIFLYKIKYNTIYFVLIFKIFFVSGMSITQKNNLWMQKKKWIKKYQKVIIWRLLIKVYTAEKYGCIIVVYTM